jgi:hypothetical protein
LIIHSSLDVCVDRLDVTPCFLQFGARKDAHFISESGQLEFFLLLGPSPSALFYQYASLTGFSALPQQFAIAHHQCRWNYKDDADVSQVDGGFDEHDIPYDVLWLDIEHTDGKRYFTWDKSLFPRPAEMQQKLAAKGRKMVTIIDPHIKRDSNYYVYQQVCVHHFKRLIRAFVIELKMMLVCDRRMSKACSSRPSLAPSSTVGAGPALRLISTSPTPRCATTGLLSSRSTSTKAPRRRCTRGTT